MNKDKSTGRLIIIIAIFAVIIGGISFGYAQLRETLSINGTAKLSGVKWNINLRNLQLNDDSAGIDGEPTFVIDPVNVVEILKNTTKMEELVYSTDNEGNPIVAVLKNDENGGTKIHFSVTLKEQNQKFSFKFDISNNGTLDGKLTGIKEDGVDVRRVTTSYEHKVSDEATEPHFKYLVTGMPSLDAPNTVNLASGGKKTVTITFEYPTLTDDTNAPLEDYTFEKTIELIYSQK